MSTSIKKTVWRIVIFLFLFQVVYSDNKYCDKSTKYCFAISLPNTTLPASQQFAEFTLVAPNNVGWLGVGVGDSMLTGYLIVAWPNPDGSVTLSQRNSLNGYHEPTASSNQQDLILDNATVSNSDGNLEIHFRRLVSLKANTIPSKGKFLWALGHHKVDGNNYDASISYHDGGMGVVKMQLTSDDKSTNYWTRYDKLIIAHATIMFIAWLVCVPAAIYIARFARNLLPRSWFHIHWGIQVFLVVPLAIAGGSLSYVAVNGFFFDDPHKIIGLILFIGLFVQLAIGGIHHKLFDPHRNFVPWWTQLHWWFGRALVVLAVFQVPLGLSLYQADIELFYFYYIYIFILLISFSFLSIRKWNISNGVKNGFRKMDDE
ncbi:2850_t:CDS:2 [Acaulospora morrowiae]|uniref:2850_t:CDS:1 n=1 Tax=Acaulospora morrowiae TaxID=94023 RepID=A0A9N8YYL3_9GLOM|nr:2850_t:CDS:2 [Acaulospora morrowiae]